MTQAGEGRRRVRSSPLIVSASSGYRCDPCKHARTGADWQLNDGTVAPLVSRLPSRRARGILQPQSVINSRRNACAT